MDPATQISGYDKSFKTAIIAASSLVSFFSAFLSSATTLALPDIGNKFNTNAIQLGWVTSSYILASAISMLPFGRLADIIGRRKIFFFGIILFTASTFLIVFSWNINIVIVLRVIQGLSSGMIFSTSMAIVTAVFKPGERGRAISISVTSTYLGSSFAPILGGLFTQYFGWRSIFIFPIPFQIIALLLVKQRIKTEWAGAAGEKFDWRGSILYGIGIFGIMYGFTILPTLTGWINLSIGLLLILLFIRIELRTSNPVFEFKLIFENRVFAFSSLTALINYSATNAITFFMSLYLQYLKGYSAKITGIIFISYPLAMTIMSPAAGRLSDKNNPGKVASLGMIIISVCLFLFSFINESTHIAYLIPILTMVGIGFGLFSSPNINAIMSSVDKKYLGIANGTLGTMRMIGQMMSMSIAMMLMSIYIGKEPISPIVYPGLLKTIQTGFLIFAILSTIGIFTSLARNKKAD